MIKVQARGIEKKFTIKGEEGQTETLTTLHDFNLDVRQGEFLSILGPSGCGKSTFLGILAGLDDSDGGEIMIDGAPMKKRDFSRGMVFQSYALLPWRTVLENVGVGLEIRGVAKEERDRVAMEYLNLVGLAKFANQYPHQLSGGMRQRVAIARVLAYRPDLILMDEPFAALDAQTRESLQIELLRIWEADRKTIVFITHSIDEAVLLSERVAVMTARPGRVKAIIDIDLPKSRDQNVRNSAAFVEARRNLWELLRQEVIEAQNLEMRDAV